MKGKKQKEPAGMNPAEIFAALEMLEQERGIPKKFMMEKIVQALTAAYKKDHSEIENVVVEVDEEKKDLRMYVQKAVVDEEDYVDPGNEMTLEDARKISGRFKIGDMVNIQVDKMEFGRIAAGNGKQVIIQGLREAERGMVYNEFNSKQHEILTGVVIRVDPRNGAVTLKIGTGRRCRSPSDGRRAGAQRGIDRGRSYQGLCGGCAPLQLGTPGVDFPYPSGPCEAAL